MWNSRPILFALAAALAAQPLAAQRGGTVELGAFGRWTRFGNPIMNDTFYRLPSKSGIGGGGRLGIFLFRNLEVEGDASWTRVDAAGSATLHASHIPIHAGLTYNIPLSAEHVHFLIGGRWVHNKYGSDADYQDHGWGALAGLRLGVVRIDATMDWMPKSENVLGHEKYHNFGVDAGLSLLLGNQCKKSNDGVTVVPASATLDRGEHASFTATATRCNKARSVTWSATGGTITETGEYTAGQTPGSYLVTATEPKSGMTGTADITIKAPPPPPPPPPVTMTRINLQPDQARAKVNEAVAFTVIGIMSDGSTRTLDDCRLTATGNATQSGNSFSWGRYGNYTVSANCNGMSDQSAIEVPLEIVIYGANFAFNKDFLTPSGRDSVRAAADSLKLYPEIKVRLGGFADFVGTDPYNCGLSWRRVRTVQRTLAEFGIGEDRISAVEGFGHAYPIPDDQVPQAWKDINAARHDRGKWWDRRVDVTSASKGPGMMACTEPAARTTPAKKKP